MQQTASTKTVSHPAIDQTTIGLREKLRAATAAEHEALDSDLAALNLAHLDDYRFFLKASAAALLPIEQALEKAGVEQYFPDWPVRMRSQAILADLDQLGGPPDPLATPILDGDRLFGAMYALEGSRLGARYLLRAVKASGDLRVNTASGYLAHGYGHGLWPTFLTQLESRADEIDLCHAVEGARIVFALFTQAFTVHPDAS